MALVCGVAIMVIRTFRQGGALAPSGSKKWGKIYKILGFIRLCPSPGNRMLGKKQLKIRGLVRQRENRPPPLKNGAEQKNAEDIFFTPKQVSPIR